ncbi:Uma2 family endonuclease [Tautonia marina]|uniref:Uma2 family endonuclease n=1 Tax=Tautonia marina TaxID=2653855 RepID=UPI001260CA07|nr:Uma2 family endonuclease [Tautonia marina]
MATATETTVLSRSTTEADLLRDEPEGLYEVIDEQIVEKPPMGAFEAWVASVLFRGLVTNSQVVEQGRVASELLFRLDAERRLDRRPDLAFISFDRWPKARPVPRAAAWEVVPDLAIEVISPSNKTADDLRAVEDYFRAGTRQVWLVVPGVNRVYVFTSPTSVTIRSLGESLDGGDLLPGFSLSVLELFGDANA